MKILIAVLLIASVERLQARDFSWESAKNSVSELTEEQEYAVLLQRLGELEELDFAPRSGDHYGYEEHSEYPPERWVEKWPTCGGLKQSPINVDPSSCKRDLALFPIKLNNYDVNPVTSTVTNVGHAVQVSFTYGKNAPYVTRGILNLKRYNFQQFHFHFGKTDSVGSEHTLSSKHYPLELHLVHSKSTYADVSEASQHSDGLLVLGFLFQVSDADDDETNNSLSGYLTDFLSQIKNSGESVTVDNAKSHRLLDFIGSLSFKYVRYEGSLTTPPCSEAVTWYVSSTILKVSRATLEGFRGVNGDEGQMAGNHRPTQDLNGRDCYVR
ncbi:carbonic anhydrase 2-like [Phlebotomus argentipes]|uniref:carbonic anhydrase 2-like n=1 Tax=Phlebotomus argentipes TaxID=94469 RepID=UPI0028932A75|nr:carbonic anhydrase 2-like [Phlebotomus argentipes]